MFASRRILQGHGKIITPQTMVINPNGQTTAGAPPWTASGATMSFGKNVTAGNGVLTYLFGGTGDVISAIEAAGVASTEMVPVTDGYNASLWWAPNSPGGTSAVTVTESSVGSGWTGSAFEISGVQRGAIITATDPGTGSGGGPYSSSLTLSPTIIGQLIMFFPMGLYGNSSTLSGSSGLTHLSGGGIGDVQGAYIITTSLNPITATWTVASGTAIGSIGVVIV